MAARSAAQKLKTASAAKPAGGDKRVAIIDAALALFRANGYRRTAMEDIAQAANVAKGTLYLYFKSKDELFEALARLLASRIQADLEAAAARDLPLQGKVLAVLDAKLGFFFRSVLSSPHAAELLEPRANLPGDIFEPVNQAFRGMLAKALREGVKRGEIDPRAAGLSLDMALETLLAAAYGAEHGGGSETDFHDRLARIVALTLRGLRP
ncbi:MAG TPA: helix-turn-helix domain-containing protein [Parvibaculum sp.]